MEDPNSSALHSRAERVRAFNRFYTQRIGAARGDYLDSPYSLAEMRILYELAHREDAVTLSTLAGEMQLDAGYLSRTLKRFSDEGLVRRSTHPDDSRQVLLRLTAAGRRAFAPFERRSQMQAEQMLQRMPEQGRRSLLAAMSTIEGACGSEGGAATIREHRPGDLGWVVEAHGRLYAQEYGWNGEFEALVAEIAARFLRGFDPARERCFIAEHNGFNVGSCMLVRKSAKTAQLRCVLVEPGARGQRLGRRLVDEALAFARRAGYSGVMLWTNDCLHAARAIYESVGFRLVEEEPHHSFGHDLVGQKWSLRL